MFWKKHTWAILYGVLLIIFTAYVLLDTFVITKVYSKVSSEQGQISGSAESLNQADHVDEYSEGNIEAKQADDVNDFIEENAGTDMSDDALDVPMTTDESYDDGNISIVVTEYREYDSDIYVADVQVASAEYLKTAFAQDAFGKNVTEKTSEIAENNGAILAINGDNYGAQERGYVLRNGVVYRSTVSRNQENLVIYGDGSFSIITEGEVSADKLLTDGAQQVLSFGPALVMDGSISVTEGEEVGKAKASNPRTAIGIIDNLHYVFVVSDGRTDESDGLSLYELAKFMQSLGVTTAYNLDGGGSSTMYFNGEVINKPTSNGDIRERSVSDIVYIGY